jgi:hypothetical protein
MGAVKSTPREMRFVIRYPTVEWDQVWINLNTTGASDNFNAMLFLFIHDLLPTNERLLRINRTETPRCKVCREEDWDYTAWLIVKGVSSLGRDEKEANTDSAYEPGSQTGFWGHSLVHGHPKTRDGLVVIGSYGVVPNERESKLVGAGLCGFPSQIKMESFTAARKMRTPG